MIKKCIKFCRFSHYEIGGLIKMTENFELLKHIYKDAEMSCYTLHQLLEDLKEKDNKIKNRIEEILKKYEYFMDFSKEKLE